MLIYDWSIQALSVSDHTPYLCGVVDSDDGKVAVSCEIGLFAEGNEAKIAICKGSIYILTEENILSDYKAKYPHAYRDIKCESMATIIGGAN